MTCRHHTVGMLMQVGATVRIRTADLLITNQLLYHLSYGGIMCYISIWSTESYGAWLRGFILFFPCMKMLEHGL